jgi:hypothetical protein
VHDILCRRGLAEWREWVLREGTSTGSRVSFLALHLMALHWARVTANATVDATVDATTAASLEGTPKYPSTPRPVSRPPVAVCEADPVLTGWMRSMARIEATRVGDSTVKIPRVSFYAGAYRRLHRLSPPLHPQLLNFSDFYACMRAATLYAFSFRTAAANELPMRIRSAPSSQPADPPAAIDPPCEENVMSRIASGSALYPCASLFNHSCDPNLEWTHAARNSDVKDAGGGRPRTLVAFRARRAIRAGEQLTASYLDFRLDRERRRRQLYGTYGFWCACTRCVAECVGDGDGDRVVTV